MIKNICVVGAGTMGNGIALAAAQQQFNVILFDINEKVLDHAKTTILHNLDFLVTKQKISAEDKTNIEQRIVYTSTIEDCKAQLIIEAIVEKLEAKENIFTRLAGINDAQTILASNTSSLSITEIQKRIDHPERVAGMHFFNPANIMKLVEVVKGKFTSDATANTLIDVCKAMQKIPVLCNDAPGFIVNRVARPYYLEALHLVEKNIAGIENIDAAMESLGFKMGPFKLMDLIGLDINLAVSQSLYDAFDKAERFKPSTIQQNKVAGGELGRKTGSGFYSYK
ncbi:MAG: 3-hydroxybutyryl-CoA dehydrogenase [Bacteroidetes bacterium]|nr:3-hydroxybutyryl-CoA dehydrogenase [Bacteroidota bacterium]MBS1755861.1 3-hydroxybutyryl-CoA dehydrogenase [Bacteroidota bacterium]